MSECQVDIQLGCTGAENKQHYRHIDVSCELHQEKLAKISSDLCGALAKSAVPFIVIEHPDASVEGKEFFAFRELEYESGFHKQGNKLYQWANPKNKDTAKLVKNIEKEFQKISRLNNNAHLKLSLYDPYRPQLPENKLEMLNGLRVKGSLSTDPQFVTAFTEVIRRLSHEFLNSPPMAFIELLEQMSFKLELAGIEQFPEDLKEWVVGMLNWSEWLNREHLDSLVKVKGEVVIHVTLPRLMSVKIRAEAGLLAAYGAIFS